MATAILVDAAYFLKRFPHVYPKVDKYDPKQVAITLWTMAAKHLNQKIGNTSIRRDLSRIIVYDCAPLTKRAHLPISRRALDFSKTDLAKFRFAFHDELRKLRKVALRLGRLSDDTSWQIKPKILKGLLSGKIKWAELDDNNFFYNVKQIGVDMLIGVDVAAMAHKRIVDQIILVAGDSDFVPAAKAARREGVDFILDPMWQMTGAWLQEHVDGLKSTSVNPLAAVPVTAPVDEWVEKVEAGSEFD